MLSVLVMSCLLYVSRAARAYDNLLITGYPNPYGSRLTPRPLFMPIRGAFPTIHTNLWNPVASCRPCVLSPSLRIAPVPGLGPGGIGMFWRLRHGTGRRVLPCKKANPAFQSQLINPACKVAPLKSGLAFLLRMEMARMFARHLRDGFSSLCRGRSPH